MILFAYSDLVPLVFLLYAENTYIESVFTNPIPGMSKKPYISPSFSYVPMEETLQVAPRKKQLFIGIPKETAFQENRVPLTPEAVSVLVNDGNDVAVEHGAGDGSFYFDTDYSEAGARIVYDKAELYKATTIIKSAPISEQEAALLQPNQIVISPIHLPLMKSEILEQLIAKKIIAIAFDSIKDDAGTYPIVRSMSEIAGNYAVLTAARYLSNTDNGKGMYWAVSQVYHRLPCSLLAQE